MNSYSDLKSREEFQIYFGRQKDFYDVEHAICEIRQNYEDRTPEKHALATCNNFACNMLLLSRAAMSSLVLQPTQPVERPSTPAESQVYALVPPDLRPFIYGPHVIF